MAMSLDAARSLVIVAASTFCPRRPAPAPAPSCAAPSCRYTARVAPALKFSLPPSVSLCANGRQREQHAVHWRVPAAKAKAKTTGADSNNFSSLEFMDPQTGEYKNVRITEEEEEYDIEFEEEDNSANGENDEELLKRFAAAIGLDDQDTVHSLFNKMRNPSSERIVKQLEEGIEDVDALLKDMYGDDPDFQKLYVKVESLIEKGDVSSANDIVEGKYEALLEELQEGVFGVDQVAMLDILASLYLRLENEEAAEQLLGQAKELLALLPDSEKTVDNVLDHVGTLFLKMKKPREALPMFTRSLSIKKASGENVTSIVRSMIGLGTTYSELGLGDKSVEVYKQILAYSEETLGADDEDLAAPLMHLGTSLLDEGRVDEAELIVERAMKLTEKAVGGKDARYGVAICVMAQIKGTKGEFEEAVICFRKGLQVLEGSKDFSSQDSSLETSLDTVRMDIAALLTVMGRDKEAQVELKKANIHDKQQYQYYSAQQVEYLEKLAELHAEAGELEKSERALRRSLQLLIANVGPDAIQVSVVLQLLATLLHAQPDRESEAEPLVRESLRIREKKYGKHHIAVGEACSYLASILHHQERDEEAAALMYRVLHIQEKEIGFDDPLLEETLEVLHMILMNLGRYQETVPIIQRLEELKAQSGSSFSM